MTRSRTDHSAGHRHDKHCYWDYRECGWVCAPRPAAETVQAEEQQPAPPVERPLAATR
jgi:hypothetical protein